jgi:hypothetical protein
MHVYSQYRDAVDPAMPAEGGPTAELTCSLSVKIVFGDQIMLVG